MSLKSTKFHIVVVHHKDHIRNLLFFYFYKYKLLLQYIDLEKYIHIISDNKHIIQAKIKKKDFLLIIFGLYHQSTEDTFTERSTQTS